VRTCPSFFFFSLLHGQQFKIERRAFIYFFFINTRCTILWRRPNVEVKAVAIKHNQIAMGLNSSWKYHLVGLSYSADSAAIQRNHRLIAGDPEFEFHVVPSRRRHRPV
jgi:hypothetical protein